MENNPPKQKSPIDRRELVSLAFELGFIIALPIVAFGFAGKWLDSAMDTEPLFTLLGILLAITSTSIWMYRKFKSYF
ncbi:MAG: hypothetical protein A3C85_00015 [Candidatus Doudnabacteria bacterium RIFCSPHIGHO2_02_FULL_48_21]|uniref:AtpZ/AtpI family protein n=1 Tax=Candidatus Doudnabacteria bacterium RIFCSPLOWO2_02_FULL_48_13 TaxID=1817845 RepID=A0A1F5QAC9_9BACT|nr:MAG: hypothetical protein A3K05_02795 [Candidatus Doudnabacteria bacterium RIFCSPHIGHO2_01_48_18]OGE78918.1 MAG: hypothetical protein A2668_00905 [Candidatus Doudnabacteria bacterium RIFCSPHIGHO2_01_FULL_48_180]OGE90935.1 MAG: hypothetical protein A3F44_00285 [Candidatus Doudnabacteria bacterium RIFCSPHIGHO2_12_FULL_47_25]OGE94172.1 MAG: hypothetical protein A3C85_00015 [Candidatus Doudnabacteria bacterium RIFCSPHIGHO2_02_FULL_48_21]OGE98149.1 MAG: hypothetical protein A3A83_03170 [Candidatu